MARGVYPSNMHSAQNAAQTLLANIQFASVDVPLRSIVITSTAPNEGKTTIALELARAMAAAGLRTLLVECDMRRRTMAGKLDVHAESGLYAALAEKVEFSKCISCVEPNLMFIDAEPHIPNPPSLISSKRFQVFHEAMCQQFDYVVFDTPPVAAFVDAAVLSSIADATVLVVRERFAKKAEIKDACDQLVKAGANVIGIAMNYCREEKGDYYYTYYDGEKKRKRIHGSTSHDGAPAAQDFQPLPAARRTRAAGRQVDASEKAEK